MLVSELMTTNVATVSENQSVSQAFQVLYEKRHSQLPVVEKGKLTGFITEKLLAELSPSKATSLSVFEINYLLDKTKVKDVMRTEVFTVHPEALVEDAALIMYLKDIGSLPVVDNDRNLVGILTRLDIFKAFIEMMGVNDKGTRIALKVKNHVGVVAKISTLIASMDINISHISNFGAGEIVEMIIRVDSLDVENLVEALNQSGCEVIHVSKNDKNYNE